MPLPYMSNTMTRFGPQSNTSLPKRLPISDPSQYSPTHLSPIQRSPHSPSRVDPYLHIQRSLNRLDTSLHSQYSPTQVTPPTQSPANSPLWAEDVLDIRQSKDIYRFSQATTISMFSTDVPSTILNAIIDPTPSTTSIAEPMSPALSSSESGQSQVGSSVCDSYYIFRQASFNSMILCMPPSANESRPPLYRITVSMNCFNPTSHITTVTSVRRSGMEVEVGSFEMGISRDPSTVRFRGNIFPMNEVFSNFRKKISSSLGDRWIWQRPDAPALQWNCRSTDEAVCFKDGDRRQKELARLVYPPKFEAPTLEAAFPCLQVTTEGQQLFDDVLMSALIVERKRLTPMEGKENKSLFN